MYIVYGFIIGFTLIIGSDVANVAIKGRWLTPSHFTTIGPLSKILNFNYLENTLTHNRNLLGYLFMIKTIA